MGYCMSNFFEKIGSYHIVTNLLPGVFFGLTLKLLLGITIPMENIGEEITIYYFMGFVINRISSLIVNPILKKCKLIHEASYSDYLKAAKKDSKIDVLSETNSYLRALLTSSLLLIVILVVQITIWKIEWISSNWKWMSMVFLVLLFLFAYKKQTKFINKRVEIANQQQAPET